MDVATHLEARVTRAILTGNTGIKRCYKKDIFPSIFFSLSELKTFLGNISVQMPMFWKDYEMQQQYFVKKYLFVFLL